MFGKKSREIAQLEFELLNARYAVFRISNAMHDLVEDLPEEYKSQHLSRASINAQIEWHAGWIADNYADEEAVRVALQAAADKVSAGNGERLVPYYDVPLPERLIPS